MKRQFRHMYTVRYEEGDCYGSLTPAAFLRYMQDIASLDAEDVQLVGDGYWIIKRSIISFAAPVQMHTRLELKTYGMGFSRITAQRGYEAHITGEDQNEPVISARTLWVYLDARGRPTRIPAGTAQIWLPDEPLAPQSEAPWPTFPQGSPEIVAYTVRFSDIDSMKHMNNAAYVEAFDNAAWEVYRKAGFAPDDVSMRALSYDIEYLESALFGEQLEIHTWLEPFPSAGKEFTRFQLMKRGDVVLVRARSRWLWRV